MGLSHAASPRGSLCGSDSAVLVPDPAGWRRERMPELPWDQRVEVVPGWECEILSPAKRRARTGR